MHGTDVFYDHKILPNLLLQNLVIFTCSRVVYKRKQLSLLVITFFFFLIFFLGIAVLLRACCGVRRGYYQHSGLVQFLKVS